MPGKRRDWRKPKWDEINREFVPTGEDIHHGEEVKHQKWWLERAQNRFDGARILEAMPRSLWGIKAKALPPTTVSDASQEPTKKQKKTRLGKRERKARRARLEAVERKKPPEKKSKLDASTLRLLGGGVRSLSLDAENLKSKTHTHGCNADRGIGKSVSKSRKKRKLRFSQT